MGYLLCLGLQIRSVQLVGVWPVGLVGGLFVETPLVENGKVVGFNAGWRPERKFPIDMAGFAVSLKLLHSKPDVSFSLYSEGGFQETDFLSQLTTLEDLEPKAANCTKVNEISISRVVLQKNTVSSITNLKTVEMPFCIVYVWVFFLWLGRTTQTLSKLVSQ